MATTILKVIAASGGDYTSLSGWDAGEAADITAAGDDEIHRAQCNDFEDTTKCTIGGWTTDATHYWEIFANDDHAGVRTAAAFEFNPAVKDAFKINDATVHGRIIGIQILCDAELASGTGQYINCGNTAGRVWWNKCIFDGSGATINSGTTKDATILNLKNAGTTNVATNCLFYNWLETASSFDFLVVSGKQYLLYNCTVQDCDVGITAKDANVKAKNVIANDCTNGFDGTFHADSITNASDITSDAPGTSPQTGEVTYENEGGDDFHLGSGDTIALDNGTDLSADGDFAFSDDIDGDTRTRWSIGADDGPAAAAAALLRHPMAPFRHNLMR